MRERERERTSRFTLIKFLLSCGYLFSVSLPRGAMRWSVVDHN